MRVQTVFVLAACSLAASACDVSVDAQGFTTRDEKNYTVSGTPDLTLVTFDGTIEIRSWDRPEVRVVIERKGQTRDEVEAIEIKAEQTGNKILVEARRPTGREHRIGFGWHVGRTVKLVADVPRTTNLLARSGDGSIVAEAIEGRLELRTGDGNVTATDLKGQLRVHTGDGNVKVANVEGSAELDTGDGGITLDGRLSALHARSGDGRIHVTARTGSSMADDWDVTTGDGVIDVELPDGFDADLDAHSGDGPVNMEGVVLASGSDIRRDTVRGKIGRGGPKFKIRSGDGRIRLRGTMTAEKTEPEKR
jgi:Toastrack DUF4097